jgi:hypothetical protein
VAAINLERDGLGQNELGLLTIRISRYNWRMDAVVGKFVEQLPTPLFGAIGLVCLLGWVFKESKGFERIGQVFSVRSF